MPVPAPVARWLLRGPEPSVRYRALTEVFGRPPDDPEVVAARREIGRKGWAARILREQLPKGHWSTAGTSARELYRPKYVAQNWRLLVLSDLGVPGSHPRIQRALRLFLRRFGGPNGGLGGRTSEVCFTGNAARMLLVFGKHRDRAVGSALDWLVRHQKADGGWHCFPSRAGTLDCWEALAAFAVLPPELRTPERERSAERGAAFYLDRRLLREGPTPYRPWRRFHYPRHYFYDLLVGLDVLTQLGYGHDPRLAGPLDLLEQRRNADGTFNLDALHPDSEDPAYPVSGPFYSFGLEVPGHPSRWITTVALAVLRRAGRL